MKNKHDQGFSLVEILVAIVILVAFVVPTCSALVLTAKMNEKTDDLMKAQLAVSSAVETLMAEGIPEGTADTDDYGITEETVSTSGSNQPAAEIEATESTETTEATGSTETVERDRFPNVRIKVTLDAKGLWYNVEVSSNDGSIVVTTSVRTVKTEVTS